MQETVITGYKETLKLRFGLESIETSTIWRVILFLWYQKHKSKQSEYFRLDAETTDSQQKWWLSISLKLLTGKAKTLEFSTADVQENRVAFPHCSGVSWLKLAQIHSDHIWDVCNLKTWTSVAWWVLQKALPGVWVCMLLETWETCAGPCVRPSVQLQRLQIKRHFWLIFSFCLECGWFSFRKLRRDWSRVFCFPRACVEAALHWSLVSPEQGTQRLGWAEQGSRAVSGLVQHGLLQFRLHFWVPHSMLCWPGHNSDTWSWW